MQFNTLYFWLLLLTEVKQVHSNMPTEKMFYFCPEKKLGAGEKYVI